MIDKLSNFIDKERGRFSDEYNNSFAFAFSKIVRYYDFLSIIIERYKIENNEFVQNVSEIFELMKQGVDKLKITELHNINGEVSKKLHLELETFFIFAKILLDNTSRAFEFYFGQANGLSLDSHHKLSKNIKAYTKIKKLTPLTTNLVSLATTLQNDVCNYRNKQITHENSPRTVKATAFNNVIRKTRLISLRINPTENDKQIESKSPEEIMNLIDRYISEIVDYASDNRAKTCLKRLLKS